MNRQLNSLSPTIVLVIGAIINHVYKENKEMETRDLMLILSPTLPTILPIIITIISDLITSIYEFVTTMDHSKISQYNIISFDKIISYFLLFFPTRSKCDSITSANTSFDTNSEYENIQVDMSVAFMQMLILYIINNKNVAKFTLGDQKSIRITNEKKNMETNNWKHISIIYKNIEIYIPSLKLTFYKNNNEIILENFRQYIQTPPSNDECKDFTRLADFLKNNTDKQKLIKKINLIHAQIHSQIKMTGPGFEIELVNKILTICPHLDKSLFIAEFVFLNYIHKRVTVNSYSTKIINYHKSVKKIKLFNYELAIDSPFMTSSMSAANIDLLKSACESTSIDDLPTELLDACAYINSFTKTSTSLNSVNFNIKKTNDKNICAYDELNEFIQMIQNSNLIPKEGNKIKIYNTKIIKEEIPNNPNNFNNSNQHYLEHIKTTDDVESNNTNAETNVKTNKEIDMNKQTDPTNYVSNHVSNHTSNHTSNHASNHTSNHTGFDEFNMHNLSKKQRKKISQQFNHNNNKASYKSVVSTKQINEKFKSFDTTYLRKNDTYDLINTLDIFKTEAKLFEEYGLPNKLGIMLHGEPGTGKTTTIHAIASYLQKNIYYVNLSTIQTNEELQMVFDHVYVESMNGGIIVFEDIDAMTSVVHKRNTSVNEVIDPNTNTNKTTNEKLTLEYFLNLLQGSLTRDGTIFIATTNHIEKLDPAFCRVGRFDVKINMKKCDHYQIQTIYDKFVKQPIDPNVLTKIQEDKFTPAEIIFHLMNYIKSKAECTHIMNKFISL